MTLDRLAELAELVDRLERVAAQRYIALSETQRHARGDRQLLGDQVHAGTINLSGRLVVEVTGTGANTTLGKVAELRHVGIFPRFEIMREWHEKQDLPIDSFVIADGLHMNDWGYACFAQLLGDDIIKSVGQIQLGVNVPSSVQTYRPM